MSLPRHVAWIMVLVWVAGVCSAQSNQPNALNSALARSSATVSVRELSVPEKARKAFDTGTKLLAAKDFAGCVSRFQQAISAFPTFYEAYYRMGLAEIELGHEDEAESAFRKSIELSKGSYVPARYDLGLILLTQKKTFAEVEEIVRTSVNIDPASAVGHFAVAWILYTDGRLLDAEKSVREAIASQPGFALSYLLLGEIHLRQGDVSKVLDDIDAYLKNDPDKREIVQELHTETPENLAEKNPTVVLVTTNP